LWLAIIIPCLALTLAVLWWRFGPGPRRARTLKRLRQLLQQGNWSEALQQVQTKKRLPRRWQNRFDDLHADCLQAAVDKALESKDFDEALTLSRKMAGLRDEPESTAVARIQASMLEELRRLFAVGNSRSVHELAARPLLASCREVTFWQALCYLREGQADRALANLQEDGEKGRVAGGDHGTAREGERARRAVEENGKKESVVPASPSVAIDPPLYLGALLLRRGQAKDALRLLTEANRIDSSCPVVTAQLGSAMIAAGGDASFAVRTLKRALGPKGLAQWADKPARVWVEAFPERHSYVRKLASKHTFVCPLWGDDLQMMIRQGKLALAQGLYRLGNYQESADLFHQLLDEGAPSAMVLRGLGISLARIGKYDDAFKHLRIAHEIEEPKDRLTAGYLALCGARGKPSKPEAKIQNVVWAVRLVSLFNAPQDAEWVSIISELFAEAREHNIPLSLDDQLYLCEHLWSVQATDARAAQAYHHLRMTYPEAVRPEYAWLFCRAIQQHGSITLPPVITVAEPAPTADTAAGTPQEFTVSPAESGAQLDVRDCTLDLFAVTFAHETDARAFFKERNWDFDDIEFTYLTQAAELAPGRFPASLGPDYAPRGRQLLLSRSQEHEKAGRGDQALASAEILASLVPDDPLALDRLALLHHRQGQRDRALAVLARWQTQHPLDPTPMIRQAVFLYEANRPAEGHEKVRQALLHSQGRQKGDFAFWGARLVLHRARTVAPDGSAGFQPDALKTAREFLEEGVSGCPDHDRALECLAAVRWLLGDTAALAAQAAGMNRPEVADAKFHYFAGLCHWAGGDLTGTLRACQLVSQNANLDNSLFTMAHPNGDKPKGTFEINLPLESSYLAGLVYGKMEDWPRAQTALEQVAQTNTCPSASLAQAMLGGVSLAQDNPEQAVHWWQILDAKKRANWQLAEPLANSMFLSALKSFQAGKFEEAADRFRSAGKLGCRDRRLGPLLILSLFRAGQTAYYGAK
jgi:tetratricopeptide (TPR) repeat protein